jgi:hypothetical protein
MTYDKKKCLNYSQSDIAGFRLNDLLRTSLLQRLRQFFWNLGRRICQVSDELPIRACEQENEDDIK